MLCNHAAHSIRRHEIWLDVWDGCLLLDTGVECSTAHGGHVVHMMCSHVLALHDHILQKTFARISDPAKQDMVVLRAGCRD